jgi:hypothetical protein
MEHTQSHFYWSVSAKQIGGFIMFKALVPAVIIASALAAPTYAFAQSNAPVTRGQVEAELAQLERAGYNPASDQTQYPSNIQAAEQRVAAQNETANTSYGPSTSGTSASGARGVIQPSASFDSSLYLHH